MPAHPANDPLTPVTIRVPASLRAALEAEAATAGSTLSDMLRSRITIEAVKPLRRPPPRRRTPAELGTLSKADPELTRQVGAIGSNLNQLARAVNTAAVSGTPLQVLELMITLRSIERAIVGLVASVARD